MRIFISALLFLFTLSANAATDFQNKIGLIEAKSISQQELFYWKNDILFPHLWEQWLSTNIREIKQIDVENFLALPQNKAAAWFFKPKWRSELIRRNDWTKINQQFKDYSDPNLVCYYLESQQALNQPINDDKIEALWFSGSSRPDHCDPFFTDWLDKIDNREEVVWQRQIKAFYSRNGTLLRYLNRFYQSPEAKNLGEFLATVYAEPKKIISKTYDPSIKQMHEVALAAVNRMAFQDPRSASNLWLQIVKATPNITSAEIKQASRFLGIAMAKNALPEASYWLTIADSEKSDETVQHWRLQIALSKKDYSQVTNLYQALDSSLKGSNQWLYWTGVAQLKLDGYIKNENPLHELSKRRLYYGYLAAGILGTQPSLNASPNYAEVDPAKLAAKPELKRAKALFEIGEMQKAQIEWNLFVRNLNNSDQNAAAELAMSWGWYAKASQSAGWSGRYDLIDLRYPEAFGQSVQSYTEKLELPKYWVYGVMRQESRFDDVAVSPAGALGLMQVMPRTAKVTAQKHNIPYSSEADLHNAQTNISIGSHYLRDLLNQFKHPVYATAAYNAGPSRVNQWRERFPSDMTIWIESIPFDETRNYVKSVLAYSQIYALIEQNNWQLSAWTHPQNVIADLNSAR